MRTNGMVWAALAASVLWTGFVRAEEVPRAVSVTGEGTAVAPPDMATVHTGVVTQAAAAKEALAANSKAMESILAALKTRNVAVKDVQTSQFSVQPMYDHDERGLTRPEISGYQVMNQVRVRVRELDRLGEVLDSLVQAGSNEVSGVSFGVAEPKGVFDEARRDAVRDARRRAELYAEAAGVRLGKVRRISEQTIRFPQPIAMSRGFAAESSAVPVAPGEEEFHVSVDVEYALEDAE
ncbi:MAG: SIMPL domain-containing protein [Planctomycetota bacterium]|nr:SIMPL domain-containing protein [Planctomycetaceae bacterium]MDQ3331483.1 SIMPL domain-containing protein [Planctomycetota bacterium]